MTADNTKQKRIPDFHIFIEGPEGNRYAGAGYKHQKGNGLGLIIGGMRYVAFEPRNKDRR